MSLVQFISLLVCFLRNSWSLWATDSPIKRDAMEKYKISHADDISGLILEWVYAKVCGVKFDPLVCG